MIDRVLLFDLGGVLADLGNPVTAMNLSMTTDEFWAIWLHSSSVYAYETGVLSTDEFCQKIGRELGVLDDGFDEARFQQWRLQLYAETEGLLRVCSGQYRLALLSNTNVVHWKQITTTTQIFNRFSWIFLSYEIGLHKPALGAFRHVLREINCAPPDVLFLDDSPRNVLAAERLGVCARCVKGVAQVEETLLLEFGE